MGKKNANLSERRNLLQKFKIEYLEEVPSRSRYKHIFDDIKKLGETDLDTYRANVNISTGQTLEGDCSHTRWGYCRESQVTFPGPRQ